MARKMILQNSSRQFLENREHANDHVCVISIVFPIKHDNLRNTPSRLDVSPTGLFSSGIACLPLNAKYRKESWIGDPDMLDVLTSDIRFPLDER